MFSRVVALLCLCLAPLARVRADASSSGGLAAETRRDIQEKAALADGYNAKLHALSKDYESALKDQFSGKSGAEDRVGALEAKAMGASQQYLKDLGELIKTQNARLSEVRKATQAEALKKLGAKPGTLKPGQTVGKSPEVDLHPEVQLDGSGIPKELEFNGGSPSAAKPPKKSLREQILDEVRAKLGIKPPAPASSPAPH